MVKKNAKSAQSQEDYMQKYEGLSKRYEESNNKLDKLKGEKEMRKGQDNAMSVFINTIKKQPSVLDKWDDTIWSVIVEKGIVHRGGSITFVFSMGQKLKSHNNKRLIIEGLTKKRSLISYVIIATIGYIWYNVNVIRIVYF